MKVESEPPEILARASAVSAVTSLDGRLGVVGRRGIAEQQALTRIASLAAQILVSLRAPGRGRGHSSERQLRSFLSDDGFTYSSTDVAPALALLEAAGYIDRPRGRDSS